MKRLWLRRGAAALLLSALAAAASVAWLSERRLTRRYETNMRPPSERCCETPTAERMRRGEHVARALANCVDCHGDNLGGKVMLDDGAVGTLAGPNLTPGGVGPSLSDADLARAIVRGVGRDGRALLMMPAADYHGMDREDVVAVIAYLRSVPPVTREIPASRLGPLGRALLVAGKLPVLQAESVDQAAPLATAPEPSDSALYGEYLAHTGGCHGCHGATLHGGPIAGMPPETPPAADLRAQALAKYSDDELTTLLRTGRRPDGSMLDAVMPWRATAHLSDLELRALVRYLRAGSAASGSTPDKS